jgi:hypothetical protein
MDSTFLSVPDQTNLLEFFPSYGNVKGILWKGNGTYYSSWLDEGKKLNLRAQVLAELEIKFQTIIQNYSNWASSVFSTNGSALGSPTDRPFFLASKISTDSSTTLGFYY